MSRKRVAPNAAALQRNCALTVVPLPVSAGTNIKVMETLASERALVTAPDAPVLAYGTAWTPSSAIWVPGSPTPLCHLLRNPTTRRTLARHGRITVEDRFSWECIKIKDCAAAPTPKLLGLEDGDMVAGSLPGNRLSAHQT
jgi:hypothetical protein